MLRNARKPIIGVAAFSGTGKTTLLLKLLPLLKAKGLRVGMVKHAHHGFEIDHPGKDSYALRKSGADRIVVASRKRWAIMVERELDDDPRLDELLGELDQRDLDLILVEGFKYETFPKIELHRPGLGRPLLFPDDPSVVAIATDGAIDVATELPVLDINRPEGIVEFIVQHVLEVHTDSEPA